uniref:CMP/dCMP-type deaminase domain-containing protein n=1 Tax=Magnetococcus massalia (strain MO-1) TaxID=451514 RepID=A0A1S7LJN8_MAGMO|nr:Conserved protein of unknown function. Containing cytidine and deoxycytidylate deaminase zinc-binding region. Putative CMP/dCMP deaminase, zinc-binding [Candidatus Magnetococcus massalia]
MPPLAPFLSQQQGYHLLSAVAGAESGARQEIPIGALLHQESGYVVASAGNAPKQGHDPVGHAEIRALSRAAKRVRNERLGALSMVITLAPCPLCQAALRMARVARVSYLLESPLASNPPWPDFSLEKQQDHDLETSLSQKLKFFFEIRRGLVSNVGLRNMER